MGGDDRRRERAGRGLDCFSPSCRCRARRQPKPKRRAEADARRAAARSAACACWRPRTTRSISWCLKTLLAQVGIEPDGRRGRRRRRVEAWERGPLGPDPDGRADAGDGRPDRHPRDPRAGNAPSGRARTPIDRADRQRHGPPGQPNTWRPAWTPSSPSPSNAARLFEAMDALVA